MKEKYSNLETYCNTVFLQTMHGPNKMFSRQDYCTHTAREKLVFLDLPSKNSYELKREKLFWMSLPRQ